MPDRRGSGLTNPAQHDSARQQAGYGMGQAQAGYPEQSGNQEPMGDQESLAALFAPVRQPQPRGLGALYLTDQHRGTIETMLRAIQQGRPLVVLTGDPGIGKSTLLHGALDRLREPGTRVLRFVAPVSHATLRRALAQPPANGRMVLAVDGAELLSRRMLRYLFLKARAAKEAGQLFSVLLVGNPVLASAIEQAIAFPPPAASVAGGAPGGGGAPLLLLSLAPFTPDEASRYLEHRVMATGYPARQLMTASAKRIIANGSAGVPAHVDRLLDLSLKHASEQSQDWITAPVARAAWAEGNGRSARSKVGAVARGAALVGVLAVLAVVGYEAFAPEPHWGDDSSHSLTADAWAGTMQHAREAVPPAPGLDTSGQARPSQADGPSRIVVADAGAVGTVAAAAQGGADGARASAAPAGMREGAADGAREAAAGGTRGRAPGGEASQTRFGLNEGAAPAYPGPTGLGVASTPGSGAALIPGTSLSGGANGSALPRAVTDPTTPPPARDASTSPAATGAASSTEPEGNDDDAAALPADLQARYDQVNAKLREIEQTLRDLDQADASAGRPTPGTTTASQVPAGAGSSPSSFNQPGGLAASEPASSAAPGHVSGDADEPGLSSSAAPAVVPSGSEMNEAPTSSEAAGQALPAPAAPQVPVAPSRPAAASGAVAPPAPAAPQLPIASAPADSLAPPAPVAPPALPAAPPAVTAVQPEIADRQVPAAAGVQAPAARATENPAGTNAGTSERDAQAPAVATVQSAVPTPASQPLPMTAAQAPVTAAAPATDASSPGDAPMPPPASAQPGAVTEAPGRSGASPSPGANVQSSGPTGGAVTALPPAEPEPTATQVPAAAPASSTVVGPQSSGTLTSRAPLSNAVIATLVRRGEAMRATGDISAARLLFDRAAEAGDASAALEAGRLRDPSYLAQFRAIGVAADPAAAAAWYRRAAALGNPNAAAQLQHLQEAAR